MFYNGRGNGAARTIVNIPDRLIRKKIQTNSGEPGTAANNVVSSSRKGPDRGSLPEYVPHIRVPLTSSLAFLCYLSYSVIKWCQIRIDFKEMQMRAVTTNADVLIVSPLIYAIKKINEGGDFSTNVGYK